MGSIRPGDDALHYCDGSHRWIAPVGADHDTWVGVVRAHQEEHLATMGGPVSSSAEVRRLYVPQRCTDFGQDPRRKAG